jgi:hypothetical protein
MSQRLYHDTRTGKLVHVKPSSQPGIFLWYFDKDGKPAGRCSASTLTEFNERFKLATRNVIAERKAA